MTESQRAHHEDCPPADELEEAEVTGFIINGCTPVWLPFPHNPSGNNAYPACPPPPPPPLSVASR